MSAFNRKVARERMASVLTTALTPTLAQAVYAYTPAKFSGQSPVVCVASGGSERTRAHVGTNTWDTWVYLTLFVFVLYAELPGGTWTRQNAEDRLDALEQAIADAVMTYKSDAGYWDGLYFAAPSRIEGPVVIGDAYLLETFQLKARVVHG